MTPLEWFDSIEASFIAEHVSPHRFLRTDGNAHPYEVEHFGDEVSFFKNGHRTSETLIVCFTGLHRTLFCPVPAFLQMVGSTGADVIIVHDRRRRWFLSGVEGLTNSFFETIQFIKKIAAKENYSKIITYGTSMGGAPAVRAGLMVGAERSISISGVPTNELFSYNRDSMFLDAFDPLCACRPIIGGENIFAYYCRSNFVDRKFAETLGMVYPQANIISCRVKSHNIFKTLGEGAAYREVLLRLLSDPSPVDFDAFEPEVDTVD